MSGLPGLSGTSSGAANKKSISDASLSTPESVSSSSIADLKLTAEKLVREQASARDELELANSKLKKLTEQIIVHKEKLQIAYDENAELKIKQKEAEKLWKGLESEFLSTKGLYEKLTVTLQQLNVQVQQAEKDEAYFEDILSATSVTLNEVHENLKSMSLEWDSSEQTIRTCEKELMELGHEKGNLETAFRNEQSKTAGLIEQKGYTDGMQATQKTTSLVGKRKGEGGGGGREKKGKGKDGDGGLPPEELPQHVLSRITYFTEELPQHRHPAYEVVKVLTKDRKIYFPENEAGDLFGTPIGQKFSMYYHDFMNTFYVMDLGPPKLMDVGRVRRERRRQLGGQWSTFVASQNVTDEEYVEVTFYRCSDTLSFNITTRRPIDEDPEELFSEWLARTITGGRTEKEAEGGGAAGNGGATGGEAAADGSESTEVQKGEVEEEGSSRKKPKMKK